MADSIGGPFGPKTPEDLTRPDVGFHDDKVGAQIKGEEAALARSARGKQDQRPKRIEREPQQVTRAASFRGAHQQGGPVEEQARRQRALVAGQHAPRRDAGARAPAAGGHRDAQAARALGRVQVLFGAMVTLRQGPPAAALRGVGEDLLADAEADEAAAPSGPGHRRVEAVDEQPQRKRQGATPDEPQASDAGGDLEPAALLLPAATGDEAGMRLARAEQEARYHLQHLVAGGSGFALAATAGQAFAEFFARIETWPMGVAPGYAPQSDADFDLFFAWIFAPLQVDVEDAELLEGQRHGASEAK